MNNIEKKNIYNAIQNLYNMDFTSWQEVLAMMYNLVSDTTQKFDVFEQRFIILLGNEVSKAIKELHENGQLADIINVEIFKKLNSNIEAVAKNVYDQLDKNILQTNINKVIDFTDYSSNKMINNTLECHGNSLHEIYNIMKYSEEFDNVWLKTEYVNTDDVININGIKLTKISLTRFYDVLRTASGVGATQSGKKYLCSAYCYTKNKPFFFYHSDVVNGCNEAVYCDNSLRRFWFVLEGGKNINWCIKGNSGYNDIEDGFYIGGFQIEEIPSDIKNGIIVIGDSTVQGSAGGGAGNWAGGDIMQNTEWVKFVGSLLNVKFFNRGIGGNTTQQMIDRWSIDITPYKDKVKYCIIQGGINDLETKTANEIVNNHKIMHNLAMTDGLIPIHCTLTPCNKTAEIEEKRVDVNKQLRELYSDILDLDTLLKDVKEPNKIVQIDKLWYGDNVHYSQKSKLMVANYIASRKFWNFRKPKPYQFVNNYDYSTFKNRSIKIYSSDDSCIKGELTDYADGSKLYLYHKDKTNVEINYLYNIMNIKNSNGDINITPKGQLNLKKIVTCDDELRLPTEPPSVLYKGQIWQENGKLYTSIGSTKREIQLV